jgi:Tol biopolymer transport system component
VCGNPHRVTTHAGDQTVPTWSHDGKWIYFSEDRGGRRELWRIRASGGEPEQITRTGSGFLGIEVRSHRRTSDADVSSTPPGATVFYH